MANLLMAELVLPIGLQDVKRLINEWNQGKERAGIWNSNLGLRQIGNLAATTLGVWASGQCAIIAERTTEQITKLSLVAVKGTLPDPHTFRAWNQIGARCVREKLATTFEPIGDAPPNGWVADGLLKSQ